MGSATYTDLSKTLTVMFVLFFVFMEADCLGVLDQKTARLTTFGNQAPPNKPQTTTPAPTGKECRTEQECNFVHNSACMKDPKDASKMRCLCQDKSVPKAGSCKHSKTGLHARCNSNEDCIENAECKVPTNSTTSNNANYKACICKEGFDEEDHACNGGILTAVPSLQSGFLLLLFPVLQMIRY